MTLTIKRRFASMTQLSSTPKTFISYHHLWWWGYRSL